MRPKRSSVRRAISSGTPSPARRPARRGRGRRSPSPRLGALAVANVDGDRCAALVQARGGGATETARGAGDDGDATGEISVFHQENCFTAPEISAISSTPRSQHRYLRSG